MSNVTSGSIVADSESVIVDGLIEGIIYRSPLKSKYQCFMMFYACVQRIFSGLFWIKIMFLVSTYNQISVCMHFQLHTKNKNNGRLLFTLQVHYCLPYWFSHSNKPCKLYCPYFFPWFSPVFRGGFRSPSPWQLMWKIAMPGKCESKNCGKMVIITSYGPKYQWNQWLCHVIFNGIIHEP